MANGYLYCFKNKRKFQIHRDQTFVIDFSQFEDADSEFKCCQTCNPARSTQDVF